MVGENTIRCVTIWRMYTNEKLGWQKYIWWLISAVLVFVYIWIWWPQLTEKVNLEYLENLYATSQWMIPLSSRIMSDSELYQLAGYRLVWEKAGLYSINPETPPLGKILFGLAIGWWSQPQIVSVLVWLAVVASVVWLAWRWFGKFYEMSAAAWWLIVTPLFAMQLNAVMLDNLQLLFLVWHWIAMSYYRRGSRWRWLPLVCAGGCLGFFAGVKVPFFLPFVGIADMWWLWEKRLKDRKQEWKSFVWMMIILVAGIGIGWLATYGLFFARGLSIVEWLRGQKWTLDFYLHASHGQTFLAPMMVWITSLTGWYQSESAWVHNTGWSVAWTCFWVLVWWRRRDWHRRWRTSEVKWRYLAVTLGCLMIANMLTSFYPRYLLLVIPLMIILGVKMMQKTPGKWQWLAVILATVQIVWTVWPLPKASVREASEKWASRHYHDLYWRLERGSLDESWREFHNRLIQQDATWHVREVEIKIPELIWAWPWQNEVQVPVVVERTLGTGVVWREKMQTMWRRWGQEWRLVWNSDLETAGHQLGDGYELEWSLPSEQKVYYTDKLLGVVEMGQELWVNKQRLIADGEATITALIREKELMSQVEWENRLWSEGEGLNNVRIFDVLTQQDEKVAQTLMASSEAFELRDSLTERRVRALEATGAAWEKQALERAATPGVRLWRSRDNQRTLVWELLMPPVEPIIVDLINQN